MAIFEYKDIINWLDNATKKDLKRIARELKEHLHAKKPIVTVSAMNVVSRLNLKNYAPIIQLLTQHANPLIRVHALQTYFDILQTAALPEIKAAKADQNESVALTAFILTYIINPNPDDLANITNILVDDYDYNYLAHLALNTFESYIDIKTEIELLKLFKKIQQQIEPDSELFEDLSALLD